MRPLLVAVPLALLAAILASLRATAADTAAVRGTGTATTGVSHGVVGATASAQGAGIVADNTAAGADLVLRGNGTTTPDVELRETGVWTGSAGTFDFANGAGNLLLRVNGQPLFTSANDGIGCGLDADLLDGVHAASFQAQVTGTCDAGSAIRAITPAGAVTCEADDVGTYSAGRGLELVGNEFRARGSHLANVVLVAASGGDFTTVGAALASITDASADAPRLVLVAPGVYFERVVMKPWITVRGASRDATRITWTGSSTGPEVDNSAATLVGVADAVLEDLTVASTGQDVAVGIHASGRFRAARVAVVAGSEEGTSDAWSVWAGAGGVTIEDATIVAVADSANGLVGQGALDARDIRITAQGLESAEALRTEAAGSPAPEARLSRVVALAHCSSNGASPGTPAATGLRVHGPTRLTDGELDVKALNAFAAGVAVASDIAYLRNVEITTHREGDPAWSGHGILISGTGSVDIVGGTIRDVAPDLQSIGIRLDSGTTATVRDVVIDRRIDSYGAVTVIASEADGFAVHAGAGRASRSRLGDVAVDSGAFAQLAHNEIRQLTFDGLGACTGNYDASFGEMTCP